MEIQSTQNPKIKALLKLQQKNKERSASQTFVVEGVQENQLALDNDFEPVSFFIWEEVFAHELPATSAPIYKVNKTVFEKIAYRTSTGGIVGIYHQKKYDLHSLSFIENPLIVVLEGVEKPGNLGAILRSCDAAGVDAVVICDPKVDFFNPNVIRSSVGTLFTQKFIASTAEELVNFCQENHIQILSTFLNDQTQNFYEVSLQKGTALVFGTEATGLSEPWEKHSHATIKIPMMGQVDSLNVSNAVAVAVFEALRQRRFTAEH